MSEYNERAQKVVDQLNLEPHPEGGAFRETYRSALTCTNKEGEERNVSTAIYFLVEGGNVTKWHRVLNDEVWHYYSGETVVLELISPDGEFNRYRIGNRIEKDEIPQVVIPANTWQRAYTTGDYTLVGCTVSPGFDFEDYEEIKKDDLAEKFPQHEVAIKKSPYDK